MPRKPKRPCSYPGCPELTDDWYCEQHQRLVNKQYNKYQRNPESNKRYGRSWKKIRDRYIKTHPLCEECHRKGRLTPAEEVHHIIPLANGGGNNKENLVSLCKSCHSRITAQSGDRWGRSNLYTF
ncbi:MAG: HNH endonuclease [Bacillota bacterium]|nr:HNH endonuclease [Bacillota bacterium]